MLTTTAPDAWRAISPVSSVTSCLPYWNDLVTFATMISCLFEECGHGWPPLDLCVHGRTQNLWRVRPRMAALLTLAFRTNAKVTSGGRDARSGSGNGPGRGP